MVNGFYIFLFVVNVLGSISFLFYKKKYPDYKVLKWFFIGMFLVDYGFAIISAIYQLNLLRMNDFLIVVWNLLGRYSDNIIVIFTILTFFIVLRATKM